MTKIWYSGLDNYKKHIMDDNTFIMEMADTPVNKFNTVQDAFAASLSGVRNPVEVLYSGGLDSECILVACLQKNIPVIAVTMRLLYSGRPFNTHDLYYAEKFCRNNNIRQVFFDLEITDFFGNGDHIPYMEPHKITLCHVATHMWLIDRCHTFPIVGGDYCWPQTNIEKNVYSPSRHEFACYDAFMQDKGISGIGNMLSHSLDANMFFIKEHIKVIADDPVNTGGDDLRIGTLKLRVLENLGFGKLEPRHKSYGWESVDKRQQWFDWSRMSLSLRGRFGPVRSTIKWGETLGSILGVGAGENSSYGK